MGDYHQQERSLRYRAEEAGKAIANIEDHLEAAFSRCTSLDQVVGSRSAAFDQFRLGLFQDFSHVFSESLTRHWHKLCHTFLSLYSNQSVSIRIPKTLNASVGRLCSLTGCSVEAAGCDFPLCLVLIVLMLSSIYLFPPLLKSR